MSSLSVATATFVGQAQKRIGKSLIWAPATGDQPCIRNEETKCAWRRPSDFNQPDQFVPTFYTFWQHETPDLKSRFKLRQRLVTSHKEALFMGVPAPGITPGQSGRRNKQTLIDAPRSFLTVDLDGLPVDIDVLTDDDELHTHLAELWDKIDEPALQADCILHLSSSHGLLNRGTIRANLEWQLDEPMTLAEQKAYAVHLNTKIKTAGLPETLLDSSIYESSRLIFTAEPHLWSRRLEGDCEMPQPEILRVRCINGITPMLVKPVIPPITAHKVHKMSGAGEKADTRMKNDNVYGPILKRIYATVAKTPKHDREHVKEALREQLTKEVRAVEDPDGTKLAKRLSWLSDPHYTNSWNGAIAKLCTYLRRLDDRPEAVRSSVAAARAALEVQMLKARERAELREKNALIDPETGAVKSVRQLLITAPPGIGKSHAAIKAVFPSYITTKRVAYLVPRIKFGKEAVEIAHSFAPTEHHHSLIRHHIGRQHVCTQPRRDGVWLDGTADFDIWKKFFTGTGVETAEFPMTVATGPYTLTQYADKPYSRSWVQKHPEHCDRLKRFIIWQAARHKKVLVVAQKGVVPLFAHCPPNVMVTWFNGPDSRGSNDFKDCSCAIVIGRAMPSSSDLELLTEALLFDDPASQEVQSVKGRVSMGTREVRVGSELATIPCEQHPDPQVFALQKQIVDAEVRQAIHRVRLFDRTEANPVEIHLFGQADTGLVVTDLAHWRDAERTKAEVLLAAGAFPESRELLKRAAFGLLSKLNSRQIASIASEARTRLVRLADKSLGAVTLEKNKKGVPFIQHHCTQSCASHWVFVRCRVTGLPGIPPLQDFWIDCVRSQDPAALIKHALQLPPSVTIVPLSIVAQSVHQSYAQAA
jgi:hypothetical protein